MGREKFVILPDVTCDLSAEVRKEYNIDVIYGYMHYPNGVDERSMLDWKDCSLLKTHTAEEFYEELSKNPNGFTTAPANIQDYYEKFKEIVEGGQGVLSLSISSGLSGTFNFASKAREMLLEEYPDARVECIDTMRFGAGIGLMAIYASILREEGKTLEEVKDFLEANKNRFHQMGWLDDLSFVAKKGRISHSKAFMGKLIGIKPIGEFDYNGLTTVLGKAKGEKSAYKTMISYIEQTIINPEEQIILIAQSNRRAQAERYMQLIQEKFNPKKIYLCEVFPPCGINVGPGLMAAYYVGKPISKDLEEEKNLITSLLKAK